MLKCSTNSIGNLLLKNIINSNNFNKFFLLEYIPYREFKRMSITDEETLDIIFSCLLKISGLVISHELLIHEKHSLLYKTLQNNKISNGSAPLARISPELLYYMYSPVLNMFLQYMLYFFHLIRPSDVE